MAVRPQHMNDGGIVERRLRPIYDWLDNGNNKKALQEAEKVLKKSPSLQSARALKALALLRLGKSAEAHSVLNALAEEKPSDDTTLQAMTISYRESQQLQKVCSLYEAAVKAEPTSEELHSHLFMSYVRVGDHRSQQRAAMALYKFAPKNPYYFWAVMSIVLQAKSSDDPTKKGILLTLAQRMVDNFITENKMEAEQEARLYIMILGLQEKNEEILKFLESPLYARLVPGSMPQAAMPYLRKLGQWRRLNLFCKDLLLENQDRWDYYMPYFDSVFQLIKENSAAHDKDSNADDTAEKCHEFICLLVESMGTGRALRGPYLARLELWKRLAETGDPTALLGSGVALCVQYLRVFAHKPCAASDLRPYLEMLPQKEREEHCRDFLTCFGFDENSSPETTDDVQRHVNCLGVWRLCAPPIDARSCLALASILRRHYLRCLTRGLVTASLTEFCAADMYGQLAAHHYFFAACEMKSSKPIMEALCLLELVLHNSPANFHVKLLLVQLYHLLGSGLGADAHYQRLELKHIQLVSLGWLHTARLPSAVAPARALRLLADTKALHRHHSSDSVEHLTYAYKYGTFEKLVELCAWGSRLAACAWCAGASRERTLLALSAGPAPPRRPAPMPQAPTDNRDLDVIVSWKPPQNKDPGLKSRTIEQEFAYYSLKDSLVSAVCICSELADGRTIEEKSPQRKELKICLEAFSVAMETCKTKFSGPEKISISAPFPSRIIAFVNSPVPYRELYLSTFNMLAELSANEIGSLHSVCQQLIQLVDSSRETLVQVVDKHFQIEDPVWNMRDALEDISNYLEFMGVITYVLGLCHELVTPTTKKPKKKAASQSPDDLRTAQLLSSLNESLQACIKTLEHLFQNLPEYDTNSTLEDAFTAISFNDNYLCPLLERLQNARSEVINDVQNILKKKSKYLKGLIGQ